MKPEDVPTAISTVESRVNEWLSTKSFIKSARQIAYPDRVELRLSDLEVVFEQVSESFGRRVDDGSCGEMEDSLIQVQSESGTGRVRLVDFYKGRMSADFTLNEKPAYLRDQGALDESDPSNPFVIIPNYMRMQSNCINSSDYYQVCCRDLCEDLMDKLESDIRDHPQLHAHAVELHQFFGLLPGLLQGSLRGLDGQVGERYSRTACLAGCHHEHLAQL